MYRPFGRPSLRPSKSNNDNDGDRPIRWAEASREDARRVSRDGKLDGKRALFPDATTGHTPATEQIQARYRNSSANNEKVLAADLLGIDVNDQALAAEQRHVLEALDGFHVPEHVTRNREAEDAAARRSRRAANAVRAAKVSEESALRARLGEIKKERAALAERRANAIGEAMQHREAARQLWAQLVALYWTRYLRFHPDADEVRQAYSMPALELAAGAPLVTDHVPGSTAKGL
ncbi:MAG: hypothetical protein WAV90_07660 [Gordonia amarae]